MGIVVLTAKRNNCKKNSIARSSLKVYSSKKLFIKTNQAQQVAYPPIKFAKHSC